MVEGGLLSWKRQKVKVRGPTVDYSCLKLPLPNPPAGSKWRHDPVTKEWEIVPDEAHVERRREPRRGSDRGDDDTNGRSKTDHDDDGRRPRSRDDFEPSETADTSPAVVVVDRVEHVVLPSDTFQGLCLRYEVSATALRQANRFSGSSLALAPTRLVIPVDPEALRTGRLRTQDTSSLEYRTTLFLAELPSMRSPEARYYLESADGDVRRAVREAREDLAWERQRRAAATSSSLATRTTTARVEEPLLLEDVTLVADEGVPIVIESKESKERPYEMDVELVPLL